MTKLIKIILLTLLLSTTVHAGFFMDALESVRDAGVAVSGIVVDGYYGIGDVIDTITSEEFWDLTEKPDEAIK
jgi:kynurenine formamidase